jgi:hypothetical protein
VGITRRWGFEPLGGSRIGREGDEGVSGYTCPACGLQWLDDRKYCRHEIGPDTPAGVVIEPDVLEFTGPCGTPLTPPGIARYAFDTFDPEHAFDDATKWWRFDHVKSLIEEAMEKAYARGLTAGQKDRATPAGMVKGFDGVFRKVWK